MIKNNITIIDNNNNIHIPIEIISFEKTKTT